MRSSRFDIVALGEALVEFNQVPGDTVWRQGFGGDTSNLVIAAARAGARCAYASRVGADAFGDGLMALWLREGIEAGAIERDPGADTGLYFVSHGPQGHSFHYRRAGSAATRLELTAAIRERIESSLWLHVSGISQAISAQACDTTLEAIDLARTQGVRVSYDLNYRPRLWSRSRAAAIARACIAEADLFLPSIDEAQLLFGIDDPQRLIAWSLQLGARAVAVKCGARGAVLGDAEGVHWLPAHVVSSIDATGAGDCFGGVLLARLSAGDTAPLAAQAAVIAAALSTTGVGAVDPLPHWSQISGLLGPA